MSTLNINPMNNMYKEFLKILEKITIKYTYKAAECETLDTKKNADQWMDAVEEKDTFYTHTYTQEELEAVGIHDYNIISEVCRGNIEAIPYHYRDELLNNKRKYIIDNFEEQNDY